MMTRQIIQLRTTMTAAVLALVLAVSFLPAFAPPAHAGSQPFWGTGGIGPPGKGGPDEPDDKSPGSSAIIAGPKVTAVPSGQQAASNRAQQALSRTEIGRWAVVFQALVKAYWIR